MAARTPDLSDGVVRLRAFLADDAGVHLAGEDEATVRFLSGGTSTLAGTRAWIATQGAGWASGGPALVLAIEDLANGQLAGMVEARFDVSPADGVPTGAANLSYGLYPAARGRGLAARAVRLLLGELARREVLEAVIRVDAANTASVALVPRLGFLEVAPVTTTDGAPLRVFRSSTDLGVDPAPPTSPADRDTVLSGGRFAQPVRRGDEVHRTAGRGAENVHALLDHFASRGCALTPRIHGLSPDGSREVLSWLPGTAAVPPVTTPARSEQALVSVARAIRTVHDAAIGFAPPGETWQTDTLAVPDPAELIGHRDLGSWNILFDGPDVVGIIDWDLAGPTTRAFDLAIAAHSFVPLHPTRDLASWGWPDEPDRAARLAAFAAAYGPELGPAQILDALLVHLAATAGYQAARIRDHDPAWAVHAEEDHPAGYRAAARYLIDHHDTLTG